MIVGHWYPPPLIWSHDHCKVQAARNKEFHCDSTICKEALFCHEYWLSRISSCWSISKIYAHSNPFYLLTVIYPITTLILNLYIMVIPKKWLHSKVYEQYLIWNLHKSGCPMNMLSIIISERLHENSYNNYKRMHFIIIHITHLWLIQDMKTEDHCRTSCRTSCFNIIVQMKKIEHIDEKSGFISSLVSDIYTLRVEKPLHKH